MSRDSSTDRRAGPSFWSSPPASISRAYVKANSMTPASAVWTVTSASARVTADSRGPFTKIEVTRTPSGYTIKFVNWGWLPFRRDASEAQAKRHPRKAGGNAQNLISISDPALIQYLGGGYPNYSGVTVGEHGALGISAVYRAVSLISGVIAELPMRTLRDIGDGRVQRMNSFLDNPGGPDGPTQFEWVETVLLHLLLHGNAYLVHVYNAAGGIARLDAVHPLSVSIELPRPDDTLQPIGGKWFKVHQENGTFRRLDAGNLTHIPAPSTDGVRGLSPIEVARNSLGIAIAGDRAAAKMFSNGLLNPILVTPKEDVFEDEAAQVKEDLQLKVAGAENAYEVTVVNRAIDVHPLTMSAADAQFIQARGFQVEEIARWFGVPPHLLMQTDKQTSWGTGVAEQNRGLSRTVLVPWAKRIEQRLSRLLPSPRFVEFDFKGLERGSPETEIELLIKQAGGPIMTVNEARAIMNLEPIAGGDVLRDPDLEPLPQEANV